MFRPSESGTGGATGGFGIGLALARHLVELHGGSIEAHSAGLGTGSEFRIAMPVLSGLSNEAGTEKRERTDAAAARSVLIIDDNSDAADLLAMYVESCGCVAHVAYDGATGLARFREVCPDLVLLDIGMTGVDGYATCCGFASKRPATRPS